MLRGLPLLQRRTVCEASAPVFSCPIVTEIWDRGAGEAQVVWKRTPSRRGLGEGRWLDPRHAAGHPHQMETVSLPLATRGQKVALPRIPLGRPAAASADPEGSWAPWLTAVPPGGSHELPAHLSQKQEKKHPALVRFCVAVRGPNFSHRCLENAPAGRHKSSLGSEDRIQFASTWSVHSDYLRGEKRQPPFLKRL